MIEIFSSYLRPSDYFVVAFTGLHQALGGIPFEFYKSLEQFECSAMLVRDPGQRWYQYEQAKIARVREEVVKAADRTGARRLICIGNSMGGFGSLLFGSMLNADAILSFSPQSGISPEIMDQLGDHRYTEYRANILSFPFGDLLEISPARGLVVICHGTAELLDVAHAKRILASWGGQEICIDSQGHNVIKSLKQDGKLIPLIWNVVSGRATPKSEIGH